MDTISITKGMKNKIFASCALCTVTMLVFMDNTSNKILFDLDPTQELSYSEFVRSSLRQLKNLSPFHPPDILPPFIRMKSTYRNAPKYHASACVVEKSMCTLIQGIFCYLYDTENFLGNNRSIKTEFWVGSERQLFAMPKTETIFITRDPLERFMSGFMDKCVNENTTCFGCNGDVLCAVEGVYNATLTESELHWDVTRELGFKLDFGYETNHVAPQTWYCDLWDNSDKYTFIKYGEDEISSEITKIEILNFLRNHKVEEEKLNYIEDSMKVNTKHATKSSNERENHKNRLLSNARHLQMFMNVYYFDYQAFGFTPPVNVNSEL